jgi:hypothetical protein
VLPDPGEKKIAAENGQNKTVLPDLDEKKVLQKTARKKKQCCRTQVNKIAAENMEVKQCCRIRVRKQLLQRTAGKLVLSDPGEKTIAAENSGKKTVLPDPDEKKVLQKTARKKTVLQEPGKQNCSREYGGKNWRESNSVAGAG